MRTTKNRTFDEQYQMPDLDITWREYLTKHLGIKIKTDEEYNEYIKSY